MRTFRMVRDHDVSGISGTGTVAYGVVWPDGNVAIRWMVDGKPRSIVLWDSVEDVLEIHGHGGNTRIVWDD